MRSGWFKIAFIFLSLWWAYLFFTTQFVVVFDSSGYEETGKIVAHQGWAEFLRQGPQREPMFSAIVALSMRLGEWWGISYEYPLKMIGLFFLSLTMFFSYRLMRMLGINPWIAGAFVFYLGVSPTMTTSSMRLWSEFAAYPWVVLIVIWSIKSWDLLDNENNGGQRPIIGHALMVALLFLGLMSVKAIAEGIVLFYLWPFYWRIFSNWRSKNFNKARQLAAFCLTVFIVFEGCVCAYRWCNYHYNGQFAFTDRGDWAWYGNTARRMQPLTLKRLGAAVASVPPWGLCGPPFGADDCNFWTARYSDDLIALKRTELEAQGISDKSASKYFINSSMKMISSNPAQEILLMFIEAHKMFFWEPITSFEVYPDWLEKIFYSKQFILVTMSIAAILSWTSCVFVFFYLCRQWVKNKESSKKQQWALLWVFNFIFWYMALYSLYFILDRYAYPVVSLYVVLIAFLVQRVRKVFTHGTHPTNI